MNLRIRKLDHSSAELEIKPARCDKEYDNVLLSKGCRIPRGAVIRKCGVIWSDD